MKVIWRSRLLSHVFSNIKKFDFLIVCNEFIKLSFFRNIFTKYLIEPHPLTWFEVEKQVEGQPVVQFERLVGELSAFLTTTMVVVERDGPDGRFQPVKDPGELERRRPAIREILDARGVLRRR